MPYFFDTYAIVEIMNKNESYKRYFEEEVITSTLNLAELFYGFLKENKGHLIEEWKNKIKMVINVIDIETVINAIKFKHSYKEKNFSFIDCLGYSLALKLNMKFLTGDKEFEGLNNVEFVK